MKNEIRYFSMFTGVGGFELGLGERFKAIGFSEIDKYASELLKNKFPTVKNWGDCTKINPEELPDFALLCGGFPCQSFSIAGKRRGFEDTRGTMFFEISRILKIKRPKTVLLENVKGLLNHDKGETFKVILQTLDELGYETQWMVLNSKFFGVPQNRERVFIIGNLRGERRSEILPFRASNEKNDIQICRLGHMQGFRRYNQTYDPKGGVESLDTSSGGGHQPCIMLRDGRDNRSCLRSGRTTEVGFKGMSIRRLTPIECERLQGFPDNWTEGFSDTQRYKMMGNAVTVNVIKEIAQKLNLSNG